MYVLLNDLKSVDQPVAVQKKIKIKNKHTYVRVRIYYASCSHRIAIAAAAAVAIAVMGHSMVTRTTRVLNVEEVTFGQLKNTTVYIIHNGREDYNIVVVVSMETCVLDDDDGSSTTCIRAYD
jgi:hypothetical protein